VIISKSNLALASKHHLETSTASIARYWQDGSGAPVPFDQVLKRQAHAVPAELLQIETGPATRAATKPSDNPFQAIMEMLFGIQMSPDVAAATEGKASGSERLPLAGMQLMELTHTSESESCSFAASGNICLADGSTRQFDVGYRMDRSEQTRLLRQGMTAVDLGAAPGGWTWQLVKRGIRVTAVDNGPMKGVLAKHPLVEHLRVDGFKYAPRKAVDWLVCDMVEKPAKVGALIGNWFVAGYAKHAIFNLKLPMKQRLTAVDGALNDIRKQLDDEGINYRMQAKQLYHDREEVTVFLVRTKG